jgi:hypothetical protein
MEKVMRDTPTFPNWFDGQRYNFEEQLERFKGKPDLRFLQIGAYTGDATVWLCGNILTDHSSTLIDVDTWGGSDETEHTRIDFDKVLDYYESRIANYSNVVHMKMTSDEYFATNTSIQFDFIYIDGDHTSLQVGRDIASAWKLLKRNGVIAFDDYLWGQGLDPESTPKPAIDRFLLTHTNEYEILVDSYQVWLRKK